MEGMINKETFANSVLNPIVYAFSKENLSGQEKFDYIKNNILTVTEQVDVTTFEDAFKSLRIIKNFIFPNDGSFERCAYLLDPSNNSIKRYINEY